MAKLTPMKAIRKKCLDCCCGQMKEVRLCTYKNVHCTSTETDIDQRTKKLLNYLDALNKNPPGGRKDTAPGKGVCRKAEAKGSRMWGTY